MDLLTAEQLLRVQSRKFAVVDVPGVGGMRFASLSAGAALEAKTMRDRQARGELIEKESMLFMLTASCVDGVGRPIFTKETAAQFLDVITAETLNAVMAEINKLNGWNSEGAQAVAGSGEEAPRANPSPASPSDSSPSASP